MPELQQVALALAFVTGLILVGGIGWVAGAQHENRWWRKATQQQNKARHVMEAAQAEQRDRDVRELLRPEEGETLKAYATRVVEGLEDIL